MHNWRVYNNSDLTNMQYFHFLYETSESPWKIIQQDVPRHLVWHTLVVCVPGWYYKQTDRQTGKFGATRVAPLALGWVKIQKLGAGLKLHIVTLRASAELIKVWYI